MSENPAPQQAAASQRGTFLTEADRNGSVGPLTNLAHLAEFHPDLAFQEYMRRQNSAPDNTHTPLKANRQAKLAKTQSSHGAESHARANFEARAAMVRNMNAQQASGQQVIKGKLPAAVSLEAYCISILRSSSHSWCHGVIQQAG
ncbi:hypothetical protein WJX79_003063 [Trebouxia sp. C0005]